MSLQMIHMEIAYRLLEDLPQIGHPAELILGSVAPDAVHMAPHFDVDRKEKSHLFTGCGPWGDTQDSARWRRNIDAFFEKTVAGEREPARRDFALGICIHCLTDHWNDIRIWQPAQSKYLPSMAFEAFREAFYGDYRKIDWWLYQNSPHTAAIRTMLAEAAAFSVEEIVDLAELEKIRRHLLYEQYDVEMVDITSNRFLTKEQIEDFMAFTTEAIREALSEKGLH